MSGTALAPYMQWLSIPNSLWRGILIPILLTANTDPQNVKHLQEITLPLVTKLRFDEGIWLFIMEDNEGIIPQDLMAVIGECEYMTIPGLLELCVK